jgi:hypothetical protein
VKSKDRQRSLENARQACKRLKGYKFSADEKFWFQSATAPNLGFFSYDLQEVVDHLIAGFKLLDDKQAEIGTGKTLPTSPTPRGDKSLHDYQQQLKAKRKRKK